MSHHIRIHVVRKFDLERFIRALLAHVREMEAKQKEQAEEKSQQDGGDD